MVQQPRYEVVQPRKNRATVQGHNGIDQQLRCSDKMQPEMNGAKSNDKRQCRRKLDMVNDA